MTWGCWLCLLYPSFIRKIEGDKKEPILLIEKSRESFPRGVFYLSHLSNRKHFCVCIAWYKPERGWENSKGLHNCRKFSQPLEKCKAVCYHGTDHNKIEREILTSREVLYTKSCTGKQFLFCKKDAFQNIDFSHLKCQLKH